MSRRGLSLAELVLAASLALVYALAVLLGAVQARRLEERSREQTLAHRFCRNQLEDANDYTTLVSRAPARIRLPEGLQLVHEMRVSEPVPGRKHATYLVYYARPGTAAPVVDTTRANDGLLVSLTRVVIQP